MGKDAPYVLVVGAGAVGTYFAARLWQAGARLAMLCRSDYEAVCKHGSFDIKSPHGDFKFIPEAIIKNPSECPVPPDFIIVSTKALPEIDVASLIRPAVHPKTSIVLLQNGIGFDEPLAAAFPGNELISGMTYIGVTRTAPGRIEHIDSGRVALGKFPRGISQNAQLLAGLFAKSSVPCEIHENILAKRWEKLVWNVPFNPISVLSRADTSAIMAHPASRELSRSLMEEVCSIAAVAGFPLQPGIVQKNLDYTAAMKPYKTSMLVDFENKRPMEIEAILGNPLRVAESHGLSVPNMRAIYALIQLLETGCRH
ncbi:MAG: hypothetical protein A2X49_12715 [Lentisphaerae bacterium GWF2_52_8]|nr:MAG: hypothetical protein A2X49_12715 [Lentisphaerae bacterium GWF2_52_8]